MSRIRTIRPGFFRHLELFEAEKASGFPLANMQWQEYRQSLVKDSRERRLCSILRGSGQ